MAVEVVVVVDGGVNGDELLEGGRAALSEQNSGRAEWRRVGWPDA